MRTRFLWRERHLARPGNNPRAFWAPVCSNLVLSSTSDEQHEAEIMTMKTSVTQTRLAATLAAIAFVGCVWLGGSATGVAQGSAGTGAIVGRVTADKGVVRGFRVKARDTVRRISYVVYTNKGQYHVYGVPA